MPFFTRSHTKPNIKDVMRACGFFSYDAEGTFQGLNTSYPFDQMEKSAIWSVATGQKEEYVVRMKDQEEVVVVRATETREEVWAALIEQHCKVVLLHPFKM